MGRWLLIGALLIGSASCGGGEKASEEDDSYLMRRTTAMSKLNEAYDAVTRSQQGSTRGGMSLGFSSLVKETAAALEPGSKASALRTCHDDTATHMAKMVELTAPLLALYNEHEAAMAKADSDERMVGAFARLGNAVVIWNDISSKLEASLCGVVRATEQCEQGADKLGATYVGEMKPMTLTCGP